MKKLLIGAAALFMLVACGSQVVEFPEDTTPPTSDGPPTLRGLDGGTPDTDPPGDDGSTDAGTPSTDSGTPVVDSGTPPAVDAGNPPVVDSGNPPPAVDCGTPVPPPPPPPPPCDENRCYHRGDHGSCQYHDHFTDEDDKDDRNDCHDHDGNMTHHNHFCVRFSE